MGSNNGAGRKSARCRRRIVSSLEPVDEYQKLALGVVPGDVPTAKLPAGRVSRRVAGSRIHQQLLAHHRYLPKAIVRRQLRHESRPRSDLSAVHAARPGQLRSKSIHLDCQQASWLGSK